MAEFALILPLLMLVLAGILQFGLMLSANVGSTNVAREVARYGSVCLVKDAASATSCGTDTRAYLNNILPQRINAGVPAADQTSVCYESYLAPKSNVSDPDRWNVRLTVSLGIRYPLFIPIINWILDPIDGVGDGQFLLLSKEAMRVEGGALPADPGVLPCS
jgi:Flp pilus assembly protein TadG